MLNQTWSVYQNRNYQKILEVDLFNLPTLSALFVKINLQKENRY